MNIPTVAIPYKVTRAPLYHSKFKFPTCLLPLVLALISAIDCVGQVVEDDSSSITEHALPSYIYDEFPGVGRSAELISILKGWHALPPWFIDKPDPPPDWLREFHSRVLTQDWPDGLKSAVVALIEGHSKKRGFSIPSDHVIVLFDSTPAYLSQMLEIINYPLAFPDSDDPHAKMKIDSNRAEEAIDQLARMLGMLKETSYLEGPEEIWRPATVFGTRFIYYHELGHLVIPMDRDFFCGFSVEALEAEFKKEMCVDRFALGMLALETRSSSHFQVAAAAGIAAAMSLSASQEFVGDDTLGLTKQAVLRMARILHWGRLSGELGMLSPDAVTVAEAHWDMFRELLRNVGSRGHLPSPIYSLLREAASRPRSEWYVARNHIVKWCAFGNCAQVVETLDEICNSAKGQLEYPAARRTLEVVEYILEETRPLESSLRLFEHLRVNDRCNPDANDRRGY